MYAEKASQASLNLPGLGFIHTAPALRPAATELVQTHPLRPLLDGQFTRDGFPHWNLKKIGHGTAIGLGAVGHRFSRGEMIQLRNSVITFRQPAEALVLERPSDTTVVRPEDEVIFAAAAHFNPMEAGAYTLTDVDNEGLQGLLKHLGRCIFLVQGVLGSLEIQCVQQALPEHTNFSQVPQAAETFTNVVTTMVGLYLPEVDPKKNVPGPHLHALVHSNPANAAIDSVIEAMNFSNDGIHGGGHVRGYSATGFLWYQPVEEIKILRS
ncbi:MAG: acetolactate decarboxylase [Deltaproteobacteria bacterium]|nr:MAG: acetolactate decarboxylase [Deltaproteobacteria bacterium]